MPGSKKGPEKMHRLKVRSRNSSMICLLCIPLLAINSLYQQSGSQRDLSRRDVFNGAISSKGKFRVGTVADVIFAMKPTENIQNVEITFTIPDELVLLSGKTQLSFDLRKGQQITRNVRLKVRHPGTWELHIYVKHPTYESLNRQYILFGYSDLSKGYADTVRIGANSDHQQILRKEKGK